MKYSKNAVPITLFDKQVFIHKDVRTSNNIKFNHINMISLLRILAFSYMRFKCVNLNNILEHAKSHLFIEDEIRSVNIIKKRGHFSITKDNILLNDSYVDSQYLSSSLSIESIKERNVWAFGKPIIEMIPEDANVFNYKLSTINICHFINYINITFKSNMAATVLQNPIFVVFEEMNDKYCSYKMFNNIHLLSHSLFPSIYDYLTGESILNFVNYVTK